MKRSPPSGLSQSALVSGILKRRPEFRLAALCVSAALLGAGCSSAPEYRRPAIALPEAFPGAGAAAGAAATLSAEWWKLYGDAKLDELVESALERNADVRIAAARIEEADAVLREAGAAFLPGVDLVGAGTHSRSSTRTATPLPPGTPVIRNNVRLSASTSFELDFWGKLRGTIQAARAQAFGSRYAKDVVALSLEGLVAQGYFSLRSIDAQIALTRRSLALREDTLEMVTRRSRGGIASDLEVSQADAARADASIQLRELERQRRLIEHQLGALTGRLDLVLPAAELFALPLPPMPPAGLPSALLERRPDVQQSEQLLIAANAQVGVAKAAMMPSISLTGSYGAESRALATLLESGSRIWSLGFGLTLPIFDWGRIAARADAAEARERQLLASYQKTIANAFREVSDALANLEQATEAERDLQARADAARKVLRLAQLRYQAGYSAYLEVLDAQRTATEAELAIVRNRQSRLSASVELMKALGGGWTPER